MQRKGTECSTWALKGVTPASPERGKSLKGEEGLTSEGADSGREEGKMGAQALRKLKDLGRSGPGAGAGGGAQRLTVVRGRHTQGCRALQPGQLRSRPWPQNLSSRNRVPRVLTRPSEGSK